MNKWTDTGLLAVLVVAAAQIGDSTIVAILTLVIVPLAGVAWREREKRMLAERERDKYKDKVEEGKDDVSGLHEDIRSLRQEVRGIVGDADIRRSHPAGSELFPYHSRRATVRRPTSSRSTTRSRDSGRGSGDGSTSETGNRT